MCIEEMSKDLCVYEISLRRLCRRIDRCTFLFSLCCTTVSVQFCVVVVRTWSPDFYEIPTLLVDGELTFYWVVIVAEHLVSTCRLARVVIPMFCCVIFLEPLLAQSESPLLTAGGRHLHFKLETASFWNTYCMSNIYDKIIIRDTFSNSRHRVDCYYYATLRRQLLDCRGANVR